MITILILSTICFIAGLLIKKIYERISRIRAWQKWHKEKLEIIARRKKRPKQVTASILKVMNVDNQKKPSDAMKNLVLIGGAFVIIGAIGVLTKEILKNRKR